MKLYIGLRKTKYLQLKIIGKPYHYDKEKGIITRSEISCSPYGTFRQYAFGNEINYG